MPKRQFTMNQYWIVLIFKWMFNTNYNFSFFFNTKKCRNQNLKLFIDIKKVNSPGDSLLIFFLIKHFNLFKSYYSHSVLHRNKDPDSQGANKCNRIFSTLSFAAISCHHLWPRGISYLKKGQKASNGIGACMWIDAILTNAKCAGNEESEESQFTIINLKMKAR